MHQRGIMIVELLLVMAVAVIIIYLGLERYRAYYHSMQFDLVQNDVVTIREALNRYYNKLPCDASGVLQSDLNTDFITQLNTVMNRSPYVDGYHALILDSGAVTKDDKPVYQLEVTATINNAYQAQFEWLTKRLHATRYTGQTIYWVSVPNNTIAQPKSLLWVMNVSRDQFRNLKNDAALARTHASHAYCAR